ncbi:MAG: signal peptide peptidase SppA [Planctomycetes bacterium]|nr:signal peptide peptidase SppA [Planctomycetota bacterium]
MTPETPEDDAAGTPADDARPPLGQAPQPGASPRPPAGLRPSPPPRPKPSLWWVWLLVTLLLLFGGGCFAFMLLMAAAGGGGGAGGRFAEKTLNEGKGDKLALIEINGVIQQTVATGGLFSAGSVDMVDGIQRQLDQAAKDEGVKGVLLAIDSPGGTVTASDRIWRAVQDFKAESGKKVVVHMGALCASGGYYIAASADQILCEPTTITGSIGVILGGLNFHKLLEDHGVADVTITSGPNKALLSSTGQVQESHLEILQETVDDAYARFTQIVADGRGIPVEEVRGFADGRIYTPKGAQDLKLVDAIGYRDDAVALLAKLTGVTDPKLITYKGPPTLADVLSGNAQSDVVPTQRGVLPLLSEAHNGPRLWAIWRPN